MSALPLRQVLRAAGRRLADAGVPSPDHDAQVLAAHVLGRSRPDIALAAARGDVVDPADLGAFERLVDERAARVPLQHLTGSAPFRRLDLAVGPGVFVPRPETEVVAQAAVDEAHRLVDAGRTPVVVDLCAGSGAVALSVADEVPAARVHAVELSEHAAAWAARNIAALGLAVDLRVGDVRDACPDLDGAVDVVVANPPYVPPGAVPVDPEVRDHDPELALYGLGPDGLAVPALVVATAARLARSGGLLVVEHADVQQPGMLALLGADWADPAGHRDLTGRPRFVTARRR